MYQKVVVTDASLGIEKAAANYLNSNPKEISEDKLKEKEIIVNKIISAVKDGDTYYYIVDNESKKYVANIKVSDKLPFVTSGDSIHISYYSDSDIREIKKIVD